MEEGTRIEVGSRNAEVGKILNTEDEKTSVTEVPGAGGAVSFCRHPKPGPLGQSSIPPPGGRAGRRYLENNTKC